MSGRIYDYQTADAARPWVKLAHMEGLTYLVKCIRCREVQSFKAETLTAALRVLEPFSAKHREASSRRWGLVCQARADHEKAIREKGEPCGGGGVMKSMGCSHRSGQ